MTGSTGESGTAATARAAIAQPVATDEAASWRLAPLRLVRASRDDRLDQAPGALVIGGDYRGLGVVRSLGRRGIPVWVLTDEHRLAATSRFAQRRLVWPGGCDEDGLRLLRALSERYDLREWAVFPTGDETAAFVARHHAELSTLYRLTTPPWAITRLAYDKRLTYRLADQLGIDYPRTAYPRNREDIQSLNLDFPAIIKPAIKIDVNRLTLAKAWRVDSRDELLQRYDEACELASPETLMIQDIIPGGGDAQLSFAALANEGRVVASIAVRRTRQYPMDFGRASTYVESIEAGDVEREASRLLAAMGYSGLVEVEFKRDPRDGGLMLLDVNPRVWGWHSIGRRAGVDFPYLNWQLLQGVELIPTRGRAGVRWMRLLTDLPTVGRELLGGRIGLRSYLGSLGGDLELAVIAWDDPLPSLAELPLALQLQRRRSS